MEPGQTARTQDLDLLTPTQVAELLHISTHSVYRLIRERKLRAAQLGNRTYRLWRSDVDAYIESKMTEPRR